MSVRTRHFLLIFGFILILSGDEARGQWTQCAKNIVGGVRGQQVYDGGAIVYRDGILWAGDTILMMSRDGGSTWTPTTSGISDEIKDIAFFDAFHGAFSIYSGGVYITSDQGRTWTHSLRVKDSMNNALMTQGLCYGADPKHLICASHTQNIAYRTTDGGLHWDSLPIPLTWVHSVVYSRGRWVLTGGAYSYGFILTSDDDLETWKFHPVPNNSWSSTIDSCSADHICVVSEDEQVNRMTTSEIYMTEDGGDHFHKVFSHKIPFFTGALAETRQALYVQTDSNGILRTTDNGFTWKSIGGPSCNPDTRMIAAINDNVLIAVDREGSIWRTQNSGGDSLGAPVVIATDVVAKPFANDTLASCSDILRSITLGFSGCAGLGVRSIGLSGPDSIWYGLLTYHDPMEPYDSISIALRLQPTLIQAGQVKHLQATLNVVFDNGQSLAVDLSSTAIGPIGSLSIAPVRLQLDTVGGIVRLPIIALYSGQLDSFMFRISYDTSDVMLAGFEVLHGTNIRVLDTAADYCRVSETNLPHSGDTVGFADFIVLPSHSGCTSIREDDIVPFSTESICEVASEPSTICYSCVAPTIAEFLRTKTMPSLRVFPNPASSQFIVEFDASQPNRHVAVFDALGRSVLIADAPTRRVDVDISGLRSGTYFVRSNSLSSAIPLIISH